MFEETYDKTLALAAIVFTLLASLGLKVHPINEGTRSAHFIGEPPRHDHILRERRVSSPDCGAEKHRSLGEGAALHSNLPLGVGERKIHCLPSGQGMKMK